MVVNEGLIYEAVERAARNMEKSIGKDSVPRDLASPTFVKNWRESFEQHVFMAVKRRRRGQYKEEPPEDTTACTHSMAIRW